MAFFRAKARGGITPHEVDRRLAAVEGARAGKGHLKPLPPPMPHFGGHRSGAKPDSGETVPDQLSQCGDSPERRATFPEPAKGDEAVERSDVRRCTDQREVVESDAGQTDGCGSIAPLCPVGVTTDKPVGHGEAGGSPAPSYRWAPDKPLVTITIEGLPSSGKSVVTHLVVAALSAEGIPVRIPDDLRPVRWRGRGGALDNLADRGLSVVIVKREAPE